MVMIETKLSAHFQKLLPLTDTTTRLKLKTKHFMKSPHIPFDLQKLKDQKNSGSVPG